MGNRTEKPISTVSEHHRATSTAFNKPLNVLLCAKVFIKLVQMGEQFRVFGEYKELSQSKVEQDWRVVVR